MTFVSSLARARIETEFMKDAAMTAQLLNRTPSMITIAGYCNKDNLGGIGLELDFKLKLHSRDNLHPLKRKPPCKFLVRISINVIRREAISRMLKTVHLMRVSAVFVKL